MRMPVFVGAIAVTCLWAGAAYSNDPTDKVVRVAQLVIDPAQLAAYQTAVREEMAESISREPGVLAIYSVAETEHPNRLHFFEIYANDAAYRSHIASSHFQKYVATTTSMIISKELIETRPVQLSSKTSQ